MTNQTNTRKAILIRSTVVFSGMLVFALLVAYALFKIQWVEGSHWKQMAEEFSTREFEIEPIRGNIFDCKGNLLATSVPIYDVVLDARAPSFADEDTFGFYIDSLSIGLSNLFLDKTPEQYRRQLVNLRKEGKRYNVFKRKISYRQMRKLTTLPIFRKGRFKGGLILTPRTRREKPFDLLAERTIGFKQQQGAVKVGLEGYFDKDLSGRSGKHVMQRIAGGTWIPVDDELMIEAQQGKDLVTTIDINLQDVAEHALLNTLIENDADYGTAILMEVSTGELRAIANLTRESQGVYKEKYNYAVGESVEPGSTFKLVSMLALLEDGYVTPTDKVNAEGGEVRFCNATMKDSHLGTGVVDMQYAFEHSSNVAFAKQMNRFYARKPSQVYEHYKRLGLTEKLPIQINGVGAPIVKSPSSKSWSCTSLPWMAIGYELQLTPLQMLTVYNAVANNGVMVRPLLVKQVLQEGKIVKQYNRKVMNNQVCKPEVVKQLRNMMEGVVLRGTASQLKSGHYTYAGKTGTAVIANNRAGYQAGGGKSYRASFCGYFPAENPKYSCFVMISRPRKENYYAAKVALPVFKEIADKVYASALPLHQELRFAINLPSTDLPKVPYARKQDVKTILNKVALSSHFHNDSIHEDESDWVHGLPQDNSVALEAVLIENGKIPDVRGMGVRDALYLLERKGLKVEVKGLGRVKRQWPEPGTPIKKYSTIQLELS